MVSKGPENIRMESDTWIDGYDCQMTEKMLFTHGKKATIHAVYQQKICHYPLWK